MFKDQVQNKLFVIGYVKKHGVVTSGARYSGVPQKVFMVAVSVMPSLQSPKSVILIWPSLSSIRFSNWKRGKILLFFMTEINTIHN